MTELYFIFNKNGKTQQSMVEKACVTQSKCNLNTSCKLLATMKLCLLQNVAMSSGAFCKADDN